MTEALLKGLAIGFYLSISVGPVIFAIIKLSLKYGHKAGYAYVAGVSFSDVALVLVGNLAASMVEGLLVYKKWIALGGGVLLLTIGLITILLKKDPKAGDDHGVADKLNNKGFVKIFLQGFFMNTLNPAPIFLWLSWSTYFAHTMDLRQRIILFSTCLVFVLSSDIAKVLLAGKLREKLTQKTLHYINVISALILIGFGLFILGSLLFYPQKYA